MELIWVKSQEKMQRQNFLWEESDNFDIDRDGTIENIMGEFSSVIRRNTAKRFWEKSLS